MTRVTSGNSAREKEKMDYAKTVSEASDAALEAAKDRLEKKVERLDTSLEYLQCSATSEEDLKKEEKLLMRIGHLEYSLAIIQEEMEKRAAEVKVWEAKEKEKMAAYAAKYAADAAKCAAMTEEEKAAAHAKYIEFRDKVYAAHAAHAAKLAVMTEEEKAAKAAKKAAAKAELEAEIALLMK